MEISLRWCTLRDDIRIVLRRVLLVTVRDCVTRPWLYDIPTHTYRVSKLELGDYYWAVDPFPQRSILMRSIDPLNLSNDIIIIVMRRGGKGGVGGTRAKGQGNNRVKGEYGNYFKFFDSLVPRGVLPQNRLLRRFLSLFALSGMAMISAVPNLLLLFLFWLPRYKKKELYLDSFTWVPGPALPPYLAMHSHVGYRGSWVPRSNVNALDFVP